MERRDLYEDDLTEEISRRRPNATTLRARKRSTPTSSLRMTISTTSTTTIEENEDANKLTSSMNVEGCACLR